MLNFSKCQIGPNWQDTAPSVLVANGMNKIHEIFSLVLILHWRVSGPTSQHYQSKYRCFLIEQASMQIYFDIWYYVKKKTKQKHHYCRRWFSDHSLIHSFLLTAKALFSVNPILNLAISKIILLLQNQHLMIFTFD